MPATPQDVQTKLDAADMALSKTNKSWPQMVKTYGSDWHKWPTTSQWYVALSAIENARAEAGQLVAPSLPTAAFTYKEL